LKTIINICPLLAAILIVVLGIHLRGGQIELLPTAHADEDSLGCSDRTLRGSYGSQITGTIVGLGPIAGVARIVYDGQGNFTQTDNVSINGTPQIPNRPGNGTYKVESNCTGKAILNLPDGQVVHTTLVLVAHGKEVFEVVSDLNAVITSIDKRQDDEGIDSTCSVGALHGPYGITTTGSIIGLGPVGPVGEAGVITFDGFGDVSQTTTVSLNGVILPNRSSLSGSTYDVDPDCTGSITLILPGAHGPIQSHLHFVMVDHGHELQIVNTGLGRVLTSNATRQ
jgi:hypothetical protein